MRTNSLFKMDSVTEMIKAAGEEDRDFVLAYPERYLKHDLERMKALIIEYNTNRLISCKIAKGSEVIGFLEISTSEAQKIIESKDEEVNFVASRILRCIDLGMDIF